MKLPKTSPIVILTGAGISAESGIRTFRDSNGLWENHRIDDVASPEGFQRNPDLVHRFYNSRRAQLAEVEPNAAHHALARLEREWPGGVLLVTQNVDDLHDRSGSLNLVHMHGELLKASCRTCQTVHPWTGDLGRTDTCPACKRKSHLRPHIVWFGEMPLEMGRICQALESSGCFVAIGTSGNVYPAAGFVEEVNPYAYTLEMNLEPTKGSSRFFEQRTGRASELVPAWVEEVLTGLEA
jgi:NAD-dependent deacetylase